MRFLLTLVLLLCAGGVLADHITDPRYAGPPPRDAKGKIIRNYQVLKDFQHLHPCPSTGKTTGKCPGWAIDHVLSLACGGADRIDNLQWLPDQIKSARGVWAKDRFERKIYADPYNPPHGKSCVLSLPYPKAKP